MTDIEDLLNMGPTASIWLRDVGIKTVEDLQQVGSLEAYLRVKQAGYSGSLNMLWAMEAGLRGLPFTKLPDEVKRQPRSELEMMDPTARSKR